MAMTDILILVGFSILIWNAFRCGLVLTLLWPLEAIISGVLSMFVYFFFNNLLYTLVVYVVSTFLIKRLLPIFLRNYAPDNPETPSIASRMAAVAVNLVWGTCLAFSIVLVLSIMPFEQLGLTDISYDVLRSKAYDKIASIMAVPPPKDSSEPKACPVCDPQLNNLINLPMAQELAQDPRIRRLVNDPKFQTALKKKDFASISQHPALLELRRDPVFLLKALRLQMTARANALTQSSHH